MTNLRMYVLLRDIEIRCVQKKSLFKCQWTLISDKSQGLSSGIGDKTSIDP